MYDGFVVMMQGSHGPVTPNILIVQEANDATEEATFGLFLLSRASRPSPLFLVKTFVHRSVRAAPLFLCLSLFVANLGAFPGTEEEEKEAAFPLFLFDSFPPFRKSNHLGGAPASSSPSFSSTCDKGPNFFHTDFLCATLQKEGGS